MSSSENTKQKLILLVMRLYTHVESKLQVHIYLSMQEGVRVNGGLVLISQSSIIK